jgi:hypothetical protein
MNGTPNLKPLLDRIILKLWVLLNKYLEFFTKLDFTFNPQFMNEEVNDLPNLAPGE